MRGRGISRKGAKPQRPRRNSRRDGAERWFSLVFYQSFAELRAESQRTYLGFLWWLVDPLLTVTVLYIVFSIGLRQGTDDYLVFLLVGLVPWRWFQSTVLNGSASIVRSRGLMQQVHVPKTVFPAVVFVSNTAKFLVVFAVAVAIVLLAGHPVGSSYLALPLVLLVQGMLIHSLTLLAAGITPFFPDFQMALQNAIRLLFFLSGVFYDLERLPERLRDTLRLNPMAAIVESYRDILLAGRRPHIGQLAVAAAVAVLTLGLGCLLVRRYDFDYPKLS